jgi:hypothetical protein
MESQHECGQDCTRNCTDYCKNQADEMLDDVKAIKFKRSNTNEIHIIHNPKNSRLHYKGTINKIVPYIKLIINDPFLSGIDDIIALKLLCQEMIEEYGEHHHIK